jgi:hypothetical protein
MIKSCTGSIAINIAKFNHGVACTKSMFSQKNLQVRHKIHCLPLVATQRSAIHHSIPIAPSSSLLHYRSFIIAPSLSLLHNRSFIIAPSLSFSTSLQSSSLFLMRVISITALTLHCGVCDFRVMGLACSPPQYHYHCTVALARAPCALS